MRNNIRIKILVCGGRDYSETVLEEVLDQYLERFGALEIISGMAKGADIKAYNWAKANGVICHEFPADWDRYGRKAGPLRNQQMIDEGHPDLVLAFPTKKSTGTYDMIRRAEKHKIKTITYIEGNDD